MLEENYIIDLTFHGTFHISNVPIYIGVEPRVESLVEMVAKGAMIGFKRSHLRIQQLFLSLN